MYYKSGELEAEGNYKNDKLEGVFKGYYKSGELKLEANYINDKREGLERMYYESGGYQYIDTYKNGKKINRKAYTKGGKLKFDKDYPYLE